MGTQFQSVTSETLDFANLFPNLDRIVSNGAFSQCANLKLLTLPPTVTRTGEVLFGSYHKNVNVILGNAIDGASVISFGWNAMRQAKVVCYSNTPFRMQAETGGVWYVPDEAYDDWAAAKTASPSDYKATLKKISEWPGL